MLFDINRKEYVLLVLSCVLVSRGLSLQLLRLHYPSVINRGRWEGVFDEKEFLACFVSIVYLK